MKKRRFIYLLPMVLVLIVVVAGWFATDYLGNKSRQEIISESQASVFTLSVYVSTTINVIENAVKALSDSPWIAPALLSKVGLDIEQANSVLDRYSSNFSSISYLMDAVGITVASSNRNDPDSFVGRSYGFRPYFQEAAKGQASHYFAMGITTGKRGFYASYPVKNHSGEVIGVVTMKKNIDEIESFFSKYPFCFLISPDGIVFLSSTPAMVTNSLWPLDKAVREALIASRQFGNNLSEAVIKKEIIDGTDVVLENNDYFVSRKLVDSDGWSIVLLTPTDRIRHYRLIGVLATISVSFLIMVFSGIIYVTDRSKEAFRQSEESKRLLLHAVGDGIFGVDTTGNVTFVNPAALRMLGFAEEEMLSQNVHNLIHHSHEDGSIFPVEDSPMSASFTHATDSHVTNEVFWRRDGNSFPVEYSSMPITKDGKVMGAVVSFTDISERKQAEERSNQLNSLKESLLGFDSLVEKMKRITDGVINILDADFARIWLTEQGDMCDSGCMHAKVIEGPHICRDRNRCLHLVASSGRYTHLDGAHGRVPFGCYKIGRVAAAEEPGFLTNDVTHDPRVHNHDWAQKLGLVSFAGYRLLSHEGEPIGVLALFSKKVFSPEEEALLQTIAGMASEVILISKYMEALRESEKKLQAVFNRSPVGLFLLNSQGEVMDCNQHCENIFEVRRERYLGLNLLDTIPEGLVRQSLIDTISDDDVHYYEGPYTSILSGKQMYISVTSEKIAMDLIIAIIVDITDRILAEKAVQNLSSHQEALLATIPDIIMEVDANKIYTWANQGGLDFFGEDVIGKEAAYYFDGEQDTHEVVDPLSRGEEDIIYVRSWQRRRDGQKRLLAWRYRVLKDVVGNVTGAISTARDITERKLAEEAIVRERLLSDHIINSLPGIFYMFDDQGKLVRWNRKYEEVTGYSLEELRGMPLVDFFAEAHKHYITLRVQSVFADGESFAEAPFLTKGGQQIPYYFTGRLTELEGKQYLLGVGVDITERIRVEAEKDSLQAQLLQAQKMESIGRLAGGVAHDFNNMLSAILGHAELAMMRCTPSEPIYADLKVIEDSAQRSADLTRQLLAFARKQTVAPKILDLNDTVAGMLKMMLRLIGEDIDIVWMPKPGLWQIKIDPSQIDQILANLCVNARDAISGVGKVTIETRNIAFDEAYCAVHPGFACGEYVMIAVSDDGCGISKEVLDHLFEPFFTTKEVGKGTGIGLATVYGIVKQNEGFVNVYSEPDKGTTFKIYLPRFMGEAMEPIAHSMTETPKGRGEMVLVVEDEPLILELSQAMLEKLDYAVLIAGTPGEALRQAKAHAAEIQLLITDVVMPEMNGRDLAKLISDIKPGLKCLFISGYTANVIAHRGMLDPGIHFLQKPFSMQHLAVKIRETLDDAKMSAQG